MARNKLYIIVALVIGYFAGMLLGRPQEVTSTHTTVDTIIYYKPLPTAITTTEMRTISVPRLLFAPADTVHTTTVIVKGDSVELQVPIERREYRDSTYYAVVSGAAVGDIHPTLEQIQTYSRNTTQTIEIHPPKVRPYVSMMLGKESFGAGGGLIICNRHGFGVDYTYATGKSHLMARYTIIFR
ncbi:MAG: hypothetical protein U0L45_00040 [Alistipes sp.]|nr:hypothetical protein [Alistipes sp.]